MTRHLLKLKHKQKYNLEIVLNYRIDWTGPIQLNETQHISHVGVRGQTSGVTPQFRSSLSEGFGFNTPVIQQPVNG